MFSDRTGIGMDAQKSEFSCDSLSCMVSGMSFHIYCMCVLSGPVQKTEALSLYVFCAWTSEIPCS